MFEGEIIDEVVGLNSKMHSMKTMIAKHLIRQKG